MVGVAPAYGHESSECEVTALLHDVLGHLHTLLWETAMLACTQGFKSTSIASNTPLGAVVISISKPAHCSSAAIIAFGLVGQLPHSLGPGVVV